MHDAVPSDILLASGMFGSIISRVYSYTIVLLVRVQEVHS